VMPRLSHTSGFKVFCEPLNQIAILGVDH
jgi:hypothetical protein